jgi:L-iditol 2-dehydrogenase
MKAAVLYANEDIRYDDWPEPKVGPGSVKIKIHAAGICGSDVPRVLKNGAHFYPVVLGHEFSGEVVETGEDVTRIKTGDHVSGAPLLPCMRCADCQKGDYALCRHYSFVGSREQGGFAQYVAIPEINAVKFDPVIPYERAAMFEPATVALHGVLHDGYRGGGSVAILGGGTIGLFTMQWAKIFGSKKIAVFDIDDDRLALAKRLGADAVFNTKDAGFMEKAKEFAGGGFDFVFETAGNPITMLMAFDAAANKAKVCFIGTPTRDLTFTPKQLELMNRKEFRLTGSWMSYSAPFPGREWELAAHYFATGQLRFDEGIIFRRMPLSACSEAFALFKTPGVVKGKVMFVLD